MDKQASQETPLLFQNPFRWAISIACHEVLWGLDTGITEVFARSEVSYATRHHFLWLTPLSRQHCLVNFDFPLLIDDPMFRPQKIPHAGRHIHQLDVRSMETLTQAISQDYMKLVQAAGQGETHGKA